MTTMNDSSDLRPVRLIVIPLKQAAGLVEGKPSLETIGARLARKGYVPVSAFQVTADKPSIAAIFFLVEPQIQRAPAQPAAIEDLGEGEVIDSGNGAEEPPSNLGEQGTT